ncbi:chaperonin 10-like protein [Aspergillus pseudotamarii]|uniref:Chaperonin 10-like protein n=1 Tax=Aspergillus pseudotamarii TaxID=132259 RepID=A0A5N6T663_ASPPS|nr:chaperonin 10-like protein [Aspergillus pseudotamarii]KAE8141798.1 chaperonin 10-like protein [Aspergillus pseudotamarii]
MKNTALYADENGKLCVRRDIPIPRPSDGEILIEVLSSGVNRSDITAVTLLGSRSRVLGNDFCGRVLEISGLVDTTFKPGDLVAGYTIANFDRPLRYGSHQSYISIPPKNIFKVPENVPATDAAGLMTVVQTANDALLNLHLPLPSMAHGPTDGVLVIAGGATTVGISAIQLACNIGIKSIIVTASPGRHELLETLGATRCFDYRKDSVVQDIRAAVEEAGHGPVFGLDAAGTPDAAKILLDALAGRDDIHLASVSPWAGERFESILGGRDYDVIFHPPGAPEPFIMRARPADAAKMWSSLMWVLQHYGQEFRLPAIEVFEGAAEDALREVEKVADQGKFGKLVLKHPLI